MRKAVLEPLAYAPQGVEGMPFPIKGTVFDLFWGAVGLKPTPPCCLRGEPLWTRRGRRDEGHLTLLSFVSDGKWLAGRLDLRCGQQRLGVDRLHAAKAQLS